MKDSQLKELAGLYLQDYYSSIEDVDPPIEYYCWLTDGNDLYITWSDYEGHNTKHIINVWEIVYLLYKKTQIIK